MRNPVFLSVLTVVLFGATLRGAARDKWVEARSPNFVVVCNDGEGQAQKIAAQFEQIRALFRASLPYVNSHSSPVITILAVKDENSLRELLPEYWEVKGHSHPAGIFLNRFYNFQVAINLSANSGNPYEGIYHEYYHSVTVPYFPELPVWVAEGMADFYGNSEVNEKEATIGMANPVLIQELRMHPLIPLNVLLNVDHKSPYYNEQNKVNIFYAESWALAHYLMLGDKAAHRPVFAEYLAALNKGATQEEAAKAFGDLGALQKNLEHYIEGSAFYQVKTDAPQRISPSTLQVRVLPDAEVDAYRGSFLALHDRFMEAQPLLEEATRLDPKLALAQQGLALLHYFQQQQAEALASVSTAIALDPKNALTRYLRAEIAYRQSSGTHLDPRVDPQYQDDLRQAIAINPEFALPYGLLAVCLATDNDKLPEALTLAKQGVSLEPGNGNLRMALAQVLARMRRYDDAETVARQVQKDSPEPQYRDQAQQFLEAVRRARDLDARASQLQAQRNQQEANKTSSQASAPPDTNKSDDAESTPQLHYRDGLTVEGVVTQVSCKGNAMEITIKVGNAPLVLRTADYSRVGYTSDLRGHLGDIDPCTELKEHTVKVISRTDPRPGEIVHIEIEQ